MLKLQISFAQRPMLQVRFASQLASQVLQVPHDDAEQTTFVVSRWQPAVSVSVMVLGTQRLPWQVEMVTCRVRVPALPQLVAYAQAV